jgi:hypothetical protein
MALTCEILRLSNIAQKNDNAPTTRVAGILKGGLVTSFEYQPLSSFNRRGALCSVPHQQRSMNFIRIDSIFWQ